MKPKTKTLTLKNVLYSLSFHDFCDNVPTIKRVLAVD